MDEPQAQDLIDKLDLIHTQLGQLTQACATISRELALMNDRAASDSDPPRRTSRDW